MLKTDASGNLNWSKTFGGVSSDASYSVKQTDDGGYVVAGNTESYGVGNLKYGNISPLGNDSTNILLIKTNSLGDTLWTKTYGGVKKDEGFSVSQAMDNGYVIGGFSTSFTDSTKIYIIKTDSTGNAGCYEENSNPIVTNPLTLINGTATIIASGIVYTNVISTATNAISADSVLCLLTSEQEFSNNNFSCLLFPNPSNGIFYVWMSDDGRIEVFNVLGEQVFSSLVSRQSSVIR